MMDCSDIYLEETEVSIRTLKRFRESWLHYSSVSNNEIFQFADPEFYFYRFAIECEEKSVEPLLIRILYRVMQRYDIDFDVPEKLKDAAFAFIIHANSLNRGYTFSGFYDDEDVNEINRNLGVDEAFIIRTQTREGSEKRLVRENSSYAKEGVNLKAITIEDFFLEYFGAEEFNSFQNIISSYLDTSRDVTGYKSIRYLSTMNLAFQRFYEEKQLSEWRYDDYKYQIIDSNNELIKSYLYLPNNRFSESDLTMLREEYISNQRYKTMVGLNEYAQSFITSEWLYHSLLGRGSFDYTSIISGYLKSIEQLLRMIVEVNINNNCKISMSGTKAIRSEAYDNGVIIYDKHGNEITVKNKKEYINMKYHPYIELTSSQVSYMDSSIGTFEYFLRNNDFIFKKTKMANTIADMVSCFRIECRNGYFHTHNLNDADIVEKTRSNAIFLYYLLLGSCLIPESKMDLLGIPSTDSFDALCVKIREFRHRSIRCVFEYEDGRRQRMIYDVVNNTVEYTDDGLEHYESLRFYKVNDFKMETYEQIDEGLLENQVVLLTRDSVPHKIYGVSANGDFELLK